MFFGGVEARNLISSHLHDVAQTFHLVVLLGSGSLLCGVSEG